MKMHHKIKSGNFSIEEEIVYVLKQYTLGASAYQICHALPQDQSIDAITTVLMRISDAGIVRVINGVAWALPVVADMNNTNYSEFKPMNLALASKLL